VPAERFLVTRNRVREGLGVPLPAGGVQLFAAARGRPVLLGEGTLDDRAVGDDVEIGLGEAPGVMSRIEETGFGDDWTGYELTVTNDRPEAVRYEAEFESDDDLRLRPRARLGERDGRPLWRVTVPANGTARLSFRLIEIDE
jgi:hypothetical protein